MWIILYLYLNWKFDISMWNPLFHAPGLKDCCTFFVVCCLVYKSYLILSCFISLHLSELSIIDVRHVKHNQIPYIQPPRLLQREIINLEFGNRTEWLMQILENKPAGIKKGDKWKMINYFSQHTKQCWYTLKRTVWECNAYTWALKNYTILRLYAWQSSRIKQTWII